MADLEGTLRSSLGGRYDIEEEIGRGGMSVVFRAHDLKHNRTVAIKVLRPELSEQIGGERFQREIELVAGLTHPNILPLYDSGEADGLLYYMMPFLESGSLRDRIEAEGALPESEALRIVREIADALGHAHSKGVIHRDVKPGNILLSGGHALLADFGVAHLASGAEETLTAAGLALGTPAYLSPEQASGDTQLDGRSDLYSLGCVLYEALSGSRPFKEEGIRAVLVHQILDTPPPVRSINESVSPAAESIVRTAIRKKPEERFQTGEEMAKALAVVGGGVWGLPALLFRRLGLPQRRANRAAILSTAVVAIAAAAGALLVREALVRSTLPALRAEIRYVVSDFSAPDATDEEIALSRVAARLLRDRLAAWTSVSVVPEVAMEGPTAELVTAGVAQSSFTLGANLADRFGADFYVQVQVRQIGKPAVTAPVSMGSRGEVGVTVSIFETPEGEEFETLTREGPQDSLTSLMTRIAMDLLALQGRVAEWDLLQARSRDHLAIAQFDTGRSALRSWRLEEAQRRFELAIERDSGFALAHHLLAETMYWRLARDQERLFELGPLIDHHISKATEFGEGRLRPAELTGVAAFRAFWSGDYETARDRYDELIAYEPADLESLVMRGAIEIEDPIAIESDGEISLPRANLNVARRMFDTATALNPKWELSWGHLHKIDLDVARTAYQDAYGQGFEPAENEPVTPYAKRKPGEQLWFCPVVEADSIAWRPIDEVNGCPIDPVARASAHTLHARTVERLDWITRVKRDQPRHHEELVEFFLWERGVQRCDADPVHSDSLLAAAREHFERALDLRSERGDPMTPQHRFRLANLQLAAGDLDASLESARQALDELAEWESRFGTPPPPEAANPFLAGGEPETAARILERVWGENTFAIRDPSEPERSIDAGKEYARLQALEGLGTAEADPGELVEQIALLRRAWRTRGLSERDQAALRLASLDFVGPALAHAPDEWDAWFDGWEQHGFTIPAIWQGFLATAEVPPDYAEARAKLDDAVAALGSDPYDPWVRPGDLYMPILLARRAGASETVEALIERLRRCPLRVDSYDPGWGAWGSLGLIH